MNSTPKVSIIVPVYNTEKYLRKCLDSLVNQTFEDVEVVVIDDGSTDSSPAIIASYKEKYPGKFITLRQKNQGQAAARNRGIEICHGEYIGFLDSDDSMNRNFCKIMYTAAKKHNADYVACGYTDTTLDDMEHTLVLKHYVASRPAACPRDLYYGALVCPYIHFYRHQVITDAGARFPEGVVLEDVAFYMNMIPFLHNIWTVRQPLIYRLRRKNSTMMSFTSTNKVANIFPVLDCVREFYEKNPVCKPFMNEMEYMCVKILTCSSAERIGGLKTFAERRKMNQRTLQYLSDYFGNYRRNPCLKGGIQNLYIKSYCPLTADFYTFLYHLKRKWTPNYS